ncbi:MAG: Uma2 family endonuclease [Anaerolineae bacterium]
MEKRAEHRYTPEEYLAMEEAAEYKSEYRNGKIVALAGGSSDHAVIAGNVLSQLHSALEPKPCRVYGSDMRVFVERSRLYTYPDVTVICGKPQFAKGRIAFRNSAITSDSIHWKNICSSIPSAFT